MRDGETAKRLLYWYDRHARALPWRVGPQARAAGEVPNPYRVWLSEIMLQQTTVAAVKPYFEHFTRTWPDVGALADAEDAAVMEAWAGLGYYTRARNLLKCARVVRDEHGGVFPNDPKVLLSLPGIGPYTAAAISAIAFDRPEAVMDGNVERVMARLFDVETPLPEAKPELKTHAARLTPGARPGDYAQAVMDLGATICTPKSPVCGLCPLRAECRAQERGVAGERPRRAPKTPKPTRRGVVYLGRRADGAMLLERRPDKGLLGGMLGWPGGTWGEEANGVPPCPANWQALPGEVRHTFTHFHLILTVMHAELPEGLSVQNGFFLEKQLFRPSAMPTVMRKAFDLWQGTQG